MTPIISVILPTFNRAYIIKRAIDSVLKQSFGDFELIIIDDASTDNTAIIIQAYNDERIVYIKKKLNSIVTKENARNDGLMIAKGKYIAYIDSDNRWFKDHLKDLYEFIQKDKKLGMVYCDSLRWRDGRKGVGRSYSFDREKNILLGVIDTGEALHKKACIRKVGLWKYDGYKLDDRDFYGRISKYYKIKHLERTLCHYYCRSQVANTWDTFFNAARDMCQNGKITRKSIKLLNLSIEFSNKCVGKEERQLVKNVEDTANVMLLFKNKKGIHKLLNKKLDFEALLKLP